MTLATKNSRRIVVLGRPFRWKLNAMFEPECGFVVEPEDGSTGRLVVQVGLGYNITPRIVGACIERALAGPWARSKHVVRMECPREFLESDQRAQCPCCDYFSLHGRAQFDICAICGWEDDGIDIHVPDDRSGPNHGTLREAREVFDRTAGEEWQAKNGPIDVARYERAPRKLPPPATPQHAEADGASPRGRT